jgi:hypothetical protein
MRGGGMHRNAYASFAFHFMPTTMTTTSTTTATTTMTTTKTTIITKTKQYQYHEQTSPVGAFSPPPWAWVRDDFYIYFFFIFICILFFWQDPGVLNQRSWLKSAVSV